jgi:hypothetical protein
MKQIKLGIAFPPETLGCGRHQGRHLLLQACTQEGAGMKLTSNSASASWEPGVW